MRGHFTILRCGLAGIEAVEAETRHTFPRHTHEQFGIGVISRGAQKSHSGRGMVEARSGDVITVNPGEVHDGAPIGDTGRSWKMLYFDPALIAEAIWGMSLGKADFCEFSSPVISDTGIANWFNQLFSILTTDGHEEAPIRREELLLMLLARLMRERPGLDREQAVPSGISYARDLIDENPAAALTLSDLACASDMSRFQVLRGFTKATGLTPHAYLVQRRINAARRLIAQGVPLAEAAAASGFADQSHMTRIFVRKYGISPGSYADATI